MREEIGLSGLWRFQPDAYDEGEERGWSAPDCDCRRWREVRVPCSFDDCGPGMASYEGAGWFRRAVVVPAAWRGRRVVVRFEGVNYHARVWVNGEPAGASEDGSLRFELPVGGLLRYGEPNVLVVRADNVRRPGEVPGMERGWRPFGGILRDASLVATGRLHVAHVAVTGEPAAAGGTLAVRVLLANERAAAANSELMVEVTDGEDVTMGTLTAAAVSVPAGGQAEVELRDSVEGVEPWSPGSPRLYTARVRLAAGGRPVDEVSVRVGFRRIEVGEGGLLLNGRPAFLTGFNRHEDSPRTGMAPDMEMVRRDLEDMVRLGANFVRLCHYPHDPRELDLCDERGLLVMAEIPLYWWNGLAEGEEACAHKLAAAKRQLTNMIRRDVNHPSVIFWSVSNETQEQREEVAAGNAELVRLAKALDPTRPAVHVSMHWREHPHFEADDVICVNAYPSWKGLPAGDGAARFWREGLATLHEAHPGKPILVTELGHASLEGTFRNALGEDEQANVIETEFAAIAEAPGVCGATIWCYADHPWPEEPFIRYLTTSPYGVVTRERRPRRARAVAGRLFREKQGLGEPAPAPEGPAGPSVVMVRPHMRDVPYFAFPEGYSIRPMRPGEAALWTDVQRDAEPYYPISDNMFTHAFGSDLVATTWRCYLIMDDKDVAVGTISAWYDREFKGGDWGRIHFVAVRRAHQGKGLCKAAMTYTMQRMAEWHERAMLTTQVQRLGAIKIYLGFGFVPDLDQPGAREAWRRVQGKLGHPVLAGLEL